MDIAIIGACGTVGRQLALQILSERLLSNSARLQLIGNQGGASEREIHGLHADLLDAFVDDAPKIEVGLRPSDVDADIVIMLAGATVPLDLSVPVDRSRLGEINRRLFSTYATELAKRDVPPLVLIGSNPIEAGVRIFADALGRRRVLGIGSINDSLRFRRELARTLGLQRTAVNALMLGEHGSHLVPIWSQVSAWGISADQLQEQIARLRHGRRLADFPAEIDEHKTRALKLVAAGSVVEALEQIQALPPDLRSAVKPFFIHFTAGRTTEMSTAHASTELLKAFLRGERRVIGAQVALMGEWQGRHGVLGVQVLLEPNGWSSVVNMELADDETSALLASAEAIASRDCD